MDTTNETTATPAELADAFGVDDLDEIADDLYADYLDFAESFDTWSGTT